MSRPRIRCTIWSSEPYTITPAPSSALTIAGSDSGGGAGIQADLKTFAAHVPPAAFLRA